jgi:hypothetical protein
MSLTKTFIRAFAGVASGAVDAFAQQQAQKQPAPGGKRRAKKECTPCQARGQVLEARARVREGRI